MTRLNLKISYPKYNFNIGKKPLVVIALLAIFCCASNLKFVSASDDDATYKLNHNHLHNSLHYHDGDNYYESENEDQSEDDDPISRMSPDESKLRLMMLIDAKIDLDRNSIVSYSELTDWLRKLQKKYLQQDVERQWNMIVNHKNEQSKESRKKDEEKEKDVVAWEEYWHANYNFIEEMSENLPGDGNLIQKNNLNRSYELIAMREKRRWTAADLNKDSLLTLEEFSDFIHPEENERMLHIVVDETMDEMDKDNDGKISLDEYLKELDFGDMKELDRQDYLKEEERIFSTQRDSNRDGYLDRTEVYAWLKDDSNTSQEQAKTEAKHLLEDADKDRDGQLSKEEILRSYEAFINSQVTDFGEELIKYNKKFNHDEL